MEEGLLTPFGCIVQQTLLEVHPLECHVFVFFSLAGGCTWSAMYGLIEIWMFVFWGGKWRELLIVVGKIIIHFKIGNKGILNAKT